MARTESSSPFTQSPEPPVGPPLVGALLRRPLEVVRRNMLDRLHEHGFDDLDTPHLTVLQYPGPDGMRPSELAAQLRISKQALNYLLGQLERFGYLERHPDPDDPRSKRIALTARGWSLVPVVRDAVREVEADWARELGTERFAELRALLLELNKLV
jgi:DNA-binding MarR family transcriptional regulator